MPEVIDWDKLRAAASHARDNAHAPYSQFRVGAALQANDGQIYVGANVENASYGLTLCAERGAISSAVSAGARSFVALAVLSGSTPAATPCGACRQVLIEFPPAFEVRCYSTDGSELHLDWANLLPHSFQLP